MLREMTMKFFLSTLDWLNIFNENIYHFTHSVFIYVKIVYLIHRLCFKKKSTQEKKVAKEKKCESSIAEILSLSW